jgi:uncharacterized protein YoxC
MPLLLTVLSVLALWSFLTVLVFGLLLIRNTLESVRRRLEQVVMIVRAVETQTEPLGARAAEFAQELTSTVGELAPLGRALDDIDRGLTARRQRNDGR